MVASAKSKLAASRGRAPRVRRADSHQAVSHQAVSHQAVSRPTLEEENEELRERLRDLGSKVEQQSLELQDLRVRVTELVSVVHRLVREQEPQRQSPQQQSPRLPHDGGRLHPLALPPWAASQQRQSPRVQQSTAHKGERRPFDGGEVLALNLRGSVTPCVVCYTNPTQGLFSWSWSLLGTIFISDYPFETEVHDEEVRGELMRFGVAFHADSSVCLGIPGYGAGGSTQTRQRAARLALAAHASALQGAPYPDPTKDGAFPHLVRLVASLLSSPARRAPGEDTDEWSLIGGAHGP